MDETKTISNSPRSRLPLRLLKINGLGLFILLFAITDVGGGPENNFKYTSNFINFEGTLFTKRSIPTHMDNSVEATFSPLDDLISNEPPLAYFGTNNNTILTAQTGSTAIIPCVIHNIGDGTVSWIRRKDYHLLTVGFTTYSSDERFQSVHLQNTAEWSLHIKFLQKRDAGTYECQVSSHPPISLFLHLNVVEAKAHISGPSEKYLKPGSTLQLQCLILKATEAPSYVFWYHNERMINYDSDRGINVTTDFIQRTSDLVIMSTTATHTGNYTCVPNNAHPASIIVHVFYGENPAAMQSASSFSCSSCTVFSITIAATKWALSRLIRF